jgi:2-isopropylmalate synthase
LRARLEDLGTTFTNDSEFNDAFRRFKELADKKHEIFDEDLQALVSESNIATAQSTRFKLTSLQVTSQMGETPVAQVKLMIDGVEGDAQAEGSGPVDAVFKAIEQLAGSQTSLELYSVNAITSGTDSQGEVTVRLEKAGRIVNGLGADTDIIIASAKAYVHALNTLDSGSQKAHPQV